MSKIEEQLTDVIEGLGQAFESESRKKYLDNFAASLSGLSFDKFSNWELFKYDTNGPIEQHIKVWHAKKYPFLSGNALEIIEWFYMNFDMINYNIEKLVDLERGCCADKAHYIMRSYIDYVISGVTPEYSPRCDVEHKYWEPDFGKAEEWFEFIEALRYLYYGNPEKYLHSYAKILDQRNIVVKELEADGKIMREFLPTYKEILASQEDKLDAVLFKQMSIPYTFGMVLQTLLPALKDNSWTEEMVVQAICDVYENEFKN